MADGITDSPILLDELLASLNEKRRGLLERHVGRKGEIRALGSMKCAQIQGNSGGFTLARSKVRLRLPQDCQRFAVHANPGAVWSRDVDLHEQDSSGVIMTSQVVNLQVTATIPIDCDFWSEDDGWKGICRSPSVTVDGNSFEEAKKNMATELQTHIERILREHPKRSARRIA